MTDSVHFSSATDEWPTSPEYFARLSRLFNFALDPCATEGNRKCERFFDKACDGLAQSWQVDGAVFMNPPYGDPEHPCKKNKYGQYVCKKKRCKPLTPEEIAQGVVRRGHHIDVYVPGVEDFVRKAYEESLKGTPVVCLLPARTDTAWWHDYCEKGLIKHVRGRLKFGDAENVAPFPSAIVIFANLDAKVPVHDKQAQLFSAA